MKLNYLSSLYKDSAQWKRLAYQVMAYKYYLFPNQSWKGIIKYIFTSASSSPLFPFSHPNTHIIILLLTFEINKLPNLLTPELATGQ